MTIVDEKVDRVLGIFTFGYRLDVLLLLTDCRPQARQSHDCFPIAASSVALGGTAFYYISAIFCPILTILTLNFRSSVAVQFLLL